MSPQLDVTDVLTDPDFFDQLICIRNLEEVNAQGQSVITQPVGGPITFYGVVTSEQGDILERLAGAERIVGTILVITKFRLTDGRLNQTADIVQWAGTQYTVKQVNDYSRYGQGFMEATCEIIPLSG